MIWDYWAAATHNRGGAIAILILTLKEDEKILIGDKITVMVVEIRGKQNRLGIKALARVPIYER